MKWFNPHELWEGLLDWDFKKLVTPMIIRVVYVLGCLFAVVLAINYIIKGFRVNEIVGVFHILLSILVFAIYVLLFRIVLEILMALFKGATAGVSSYGVLPAIEEDEKQKDDAEIPSVPNE